MSINTGDEKLCRSQAVFALVGCAEEWAALLHACRWYDMTKGIDSLHWSRPGYEWEFYFKRVWAEWSYLGRPEIPMDMAIVCTQTMGATQPSTEHEHQRCTHEHVHIGRLEEV